MNKFRYKKVTVSPSAWQIWLVYVKYTGDDGGKKRPVLITEVKGDICSVIEISSQPPVYATDIFIADLCSAGLDRDSVIQIRKTRTVKISDLTDYKGILSSEDRRRVKNVRGLFA